MGAANGKTLYTSDVQIAAVERATMAFGTVLYGFPSCSFSFLPCELTCMITKA